MITQTLVQLLVVSVITSVITILIGQYYNRKLRKVIKEMDDEANAEIEKMRRQ